ncbi:MAG: hypothetical protein OQJ74_06400 [Ignavibacteriaceae bacterium]|nr:hypothetical protein [Ignavibacteriaceae bacterium]
MKIDAEMLVKFARRIIYLSFILGMLINGCNRSGKDSEQINSNETNDSTTTKAITKFLFLNEWFGKAGVYSYNLSEKKYFPVWWHPRENVVMLVYRPDNMPAYFLTAGRMGIKEKFPFFQRIKLFKISQNFSETIQIDKVKDGLQFTARWNADNNLELIYTSIDKVISSYVNQFTKVYDFYGKLIDSKIETFDIEKDGFPYLLPQRNSTISPSAKYGVSILSDSIFLKTAGNDSVSLITVMKHDLNKIDWSEDERFLIISTLNLNDESLKTKKPETSELFVYSIDADSLIGVFSGAGVKNFFTSGDLLIFGDGFGKNSRINIYNLQQHEIIDSVITKEACGLVFLPKI